MSRAAYLVFGVIAYVVFFVVFLYLVAFVGNLPFVPVTVDRGAPALTPLVSIPLDLALVAVFGLQHSVMARPAFKQRWTRLVPPPIERSVYVLMASLALVLLFVLWRPIPAMVWRVTDPVAVGIFQALFAVGWLVVLLSTFLISHFELFGLKQVWGHARGAAAAEPVFRTPLFYRLVRHPLYSGFVLAFWATPAMTAGHLLLAAAMTGYILVAIRYEEHDLATLFGSRYEEYRGRTGMLAPRLRRTPR